jgi:hypothetical protein
MAALQKMLALAKLRSGAHGKHRQGRLPWKWDALKWLVQCARWASGREQQHCQGSEQAPAPTHLASST